MITSPAFSRKSLGERVLAGLLIVSFFLYPITPVSAQVGEGSSPQSDTEVGSTSQSEQGIQSNSESLQNTEFDGEAKTDAGGGEMQMLSGGGDAPPGPAPGFLTGRSTPAQIDMHSGALLYSIPIDLPPGRGVQPTLALEYNNQRTQDGIVGYGWEVSIPYITHLNRTGINTLYTDPIYTSSVDGELVVNDAIVDGYRPRVGSIENHHYLFSTSTNTWTLYDKQGNAYTFGSTTDSVQSGTVSGVERTYKWMLSEIRDMNGNYATFTYAKDSGQLYPAQITYSGHSTLGSGPFSVSFATSTRSDTRESYASGFQVLTQHRISGITVAFQGSTVASYALNYTAGHNGNRSLLASVQKTGYPESGSSVTLPATMFTYATTSREFYTPAAYQIGNRGADIFADVNGNGLLDISMFKRNQSGVVSGSVILDTGLLGATGQEVGVTPPGDHYWAQYMTQNGGSAYYPVENDIRFLDINGDGRADLVKGPNAGYYPSTTTPSLAWEQSSYTGQIPQFLGQDGTTGILGEINGDGLPDYVLSESGQSQKTYLGNGSVWNEGSWGTHPYSVDTTGSTSQLVDLNGDGLDDWVYSSGTTTIARMNTGSGWSATSSAWTIATSTLHKSGDNYYDRGIRFMDINGDGLPDFVRFYDLDPYFYPESDPRPEHDDASFFMLNTGDGWSDPIATTTDPIIAYSFTATEMIFTLDERANFTGNGQMVQDVIASITSPTGVIQQVSYTPSAQLNTNPNLPISLLVVTQSTVEDAFTPVATTTYAYGGGKVHRSSDAVERTFAGFAVATTTDPVSMTVSYFHQNNGTTTGEIIDHYALMGKPYKEDRMTPVGQLLQRTDYAWSTKEQGQGYVALLASETMSDHSTSTGAVRSFATSYQYGTTTSDLIEKKEYGEVMRNSDATFTDVGVDTRTTQFEYATSTLIAVQPADQGTTTMQLLVVGGGGGGGNNGGPSTGAGGGAGGMSTSTTIVAPGTYTVTVGAGGAGGGRGESGGASSFGAVLSVSGGGGGGGGSSDETTAGGSGGSGGGAGGFFVNKNGGSGTSGQGNNGGNNNTANWCSGGGGGAGAAGSAASAVISGKGGNGATSTISGASLMYAGGGGGGGKSVGCTQGSGGSGGGANGGTNGSSGGNGGTNTGGGGGGSGTSGSGGGSGGSGIVIVRFPRAIIEVSSSTNAVRTEVGEDSVLTWSQSGGLAFSVATVDATSSTPVISRPSKEVVLNNSGTRMKETKFYYDSQSFGDITKGNLTQRDTWATSTTYVTEQFAYLTEGLVASTTDPRGNVTTYTYDAFKLHTATTTNALGHQSHAYYDYSLGKPKKTIDPNGLTLETAYDGIDRPLTERQSDPASPSTLVDVRIISYVDTIGARSVTETSYLNSGTSTVAYKYVDAFDRPVQVRKEAEESGQFSVQDSSYNNLGLVSQESLPYFSTGSSRTSATSTSVLFSTYTYDPLKRPVNVANVVGNTQTTYGPWSATTTDALGNPKAFGYDAFKRLVRVTEYNSGTPYVTQYEYDMLDNLTKITDASANIRSFTYDGHSKRLTAQDLHAPADGTFGTWTYAYDLAGHLASTTDPKAQQIDYAYDSLNRITSENYTGQAGTEIEYAYDACTYGIGRLCTATSTGAVSSFIYTVHGLPATEQKLIDGTTYTTQYQYDRLGNPILITYPNGTEVLYGYGASGQLGTVDTKAAGQDTYSSIVSNIDYAPTGQVSVRDYGNGVKSTYTYDANELYRLKHILTQVSTSSSYSMMGGGEEMLGSFMEEGIQVEGATSSPLSALLQYWNAIEASEIEFALAPEDSLQGAAETDPVTEETIPQQEEPQQVQPEEPDTDAVDPLSDDFATSTEMLNDSATTTPPSTNATSTPTIVSQVATTTETSIATSTISELATSTLKTVATSALSRIQALLQGRGAKAKADIKGQEIAKAVQLKSEKRHSRQHYDIELVSVEAIDGGVQAFIRAWQKDGTQIGFGKDGSVDVERFRIFNPPVLVPDDQGDIVQQWEEKQSDITIVHERRLREDPHEALLQVIEHNLSVMKNINGPENIEKGKKGNTVSTFYPDPNPESTSVDGYTVYEGNNLAWSTARSQSSGSAVSDTVTTDAVIQSEKLGSPNFEASIRRSLFLFDTSAISDDASIVSATFSLYSTGSGNDSESTYPADLALVTSNPGNNTAVSASDYALGNFGTTLLADAYDLGTFIASSGYKNMSMNASGKAVISKTSATKLAIIGKNDFDNTAPSARSYGIGYFADQTGTTQDPKLVVEHDSESSETIQDTWYTYDSVGNILTVSENANTDAQRSVLYTYDSLYRLLTASTTVASTTPYQDWYSYNAIGNLSDMVRGTPPVVNTHSTDLEQGSSQYWSAGDPASLRISGAISASAWIKTESTFNGAGYWGIVRKGSDCGGDGQYAFSLYNAGSGNVGLHFGYYNNGSDYNNAFSGSYAFSPGTWYHVAATLSTSGTLKLYVNGSVIHTATGWGNPNGDDNNTNLSIGARLITAGCGGTPSTEYFDGEIDDVRLWNREVSASDISTLYAAPGAFENGTNLKGWWKFDNSANDSSGEANHLSAVNSAGFVTDVPFGVSTAPEDLYSYASTNYANPHAPTAIGGNTLSYDNNGNRTGYSGTTYAWDYRNRLTSVATTTTTLFTYDHTTARMQKGIGMATTTYPNRYWEITGATSTATSTSYIFAGDVLLATIAQKGTSTSEYTFNHTDHLNGTNVQTTDQGAISTLRDYYPYGQERISTGTTSKTYIGEHFDPSTSLNYLNARHMDSGRGQFVSQDPVFWEIGQSANGKAALLNPQSMNSYSYAENNPIVKKDPDGRFVPQVVALSFLYGGLANVAFQGYAGNINSFGDFANAFGQGGVVTAASIINPFLGGGAAATLSLAESAGTNGNITWENGVSAVAQGGVTWATGGFLKGLPGVPGPQASKIFGGNYFSGAHGTRYAQEAAFGFGTDVYRHNVQQISQSLLNFYAPQVSGGRSSGGGGNINQLSQSVINYANNPGANLSDPGFVAGIRAINEYNNALTTPSKK